MIFVFWLAVIRLRNFLRWSFRRTTGGNYNNGKNSNIGNNCGFCADNGGSKSSFMGFDGGVGGTSGVGGT